MRWITGIDLRERSSGALNMSAWLRSRCPEPLDLVAVHVLEQHVRSSVRDDTLDELVGVAETSLAQRVGALPGGSPFSAMRAIVADHAEDALAEAAADASSAAIVIGRIAPREGISPVRLGRVARRLLRRLPAPVMVVPPDLETAMVGSGPVVLATDLGPRSAAAGQLAHRLARELGRPLVVAFVEAPFSNTVPLGEGITLPVSWPRRSVADVEAWIVANQLTPATATLLEGDTVERLLASAREHDAPLVVCGSRRLSMAERIFSSSVGVELARHADRPVLVVP